VTLEHHAAAGGGLIAQGPLGFGWVVGARLRSGPRDRQRVHPHRRHPVGGPPSTNPSAPGSPGSATTTAPTGGAAPRGGDRHESAAIAAALSALDELSLPIDFTFTLIALGTFVLAMVVGPVNAIVLKRLDMRPRGVAGHHRCAAVAGAIGWALPGMVRTSPTSLYRSSAEDILVSPTPPARR